MAKPLSLVPNGIGRAMVFRILFLFAAVFLNAKAVITYDLSGGRFGDNLIAYLHAKWISYQYDIPLLYRSFLFSDDLMMDEKEMKKASFSVPRMPLWNLKFFRKDDAIVYYVPYFPESPKEASLTYIPFKVKWDDPRFRKLAREMIAPKEPIQLTKPPKSTINIAIHIREGGGFDTPDTRIKDPLKLPPLDFYVEGLLKILPQFAGKPIYCYLFTDALDPHFLAQAFIQAAPHIQFDYRKVMNHHTRNVVEDFFSLFEFDILIRPQSNFSIVPALIHDYAIDYSPIGSTNINGQIKITEVALKKNQALMEALLKR